MKRSVWTALGEHASDFCFVFPIFSKIPLCHGFINYSHCVSFLGVASTGCIETSEAIMGVTKVLMASNDTLFNFEDTLGDREDMLSPRNFNSINATNPANLSVGANAAKSITPQPENCKTPTNDGLLAAYPVEYKPNDLNGDSHAINDLRPSSLQLNFENLTNNLGDLLSPEQQKTFSEEINTIEQLSSDLSATIDATNTLDDLRTCISVHMGGDDVKFGDDNSSSAAAIPMERPSSTQISNSPIENVATKLDVLELENDSHQTSTDVDALPATAVGVCVAKVNSAAENRINQIIPSGDDSNEHLKQSNTVLHDVLEPIDSAKENKSPNLDFQTMVTKVEMKSNSNKPNELNEIGAKIENSLSQHDPNQLGQLSGEEDPWVSDFLFRFLLFIYSFFFM